MIEQQVKDRYLITIHDLSEAGIYKNNKLREDLPNYNLGQKNINLTDIL